MARAWVSAIAHFDGIRSEQTEGTDGLPSAAESRRRLRNLECWASDRTELTLFLWRTGPWEAFATALATLLSVRQMHASGKAALQAD